MRIVTLLFIAYELADFLTTAVGLSIGLGEMNPLVHSLGWGWVIVIKIVTSGLIAIVLQIKKENKLDILLPVVAALFVVWNTLMIVLQVLYP